MPLQLTLTFGRRFLFGNLTQQSRLDVIFESDNLRAFFDPGRRLEQCDIFSDAVFNATRNLSELGSFDFILRRGSNLGQSLLDTRVAEMRHAAICQNVNQETERVAAHLYGA
jgi:hypothetical protein